MRCALVAWICGLELCGRVDGASVADPLNERDALSVGGDSVKTLGWVDDRALWAEPVPWWLGVASYDPSTRRTLLLPVPVNVVWRVVARWWWKLRDLNPERQRKAYWQGYVDGQNARQYTAEDHAQRVAGILREHIESKLPDAQRPRPVE